VDALDFISRSEWPLVVAGAIWLLRRPLNDLVRQLSLTKIDAWGLKAEFERRLVEAEAISEPADENNETGLEPEKQATIIVETAAEVDSPEAEVLRRWSMVERRLASALRAAGHTGKFTVPEAARLLKLPPEDYGSLLAMETLRNSVVSSPRHALSDEQARRYAGLARRLSIKLAQAHEQLLQSGPPKGSTE
jgi:hypothetical protein